MQLLTARQQQVWDSHSKGKTRREIGDALGISRFTVKDHLMAARDNLKKFGGLELPEGFAMSKATVHYRNKDGEMIPESVWPRLHPEVSNLSDFVDTLCDKASGKGRSFKYPKNKTADDDLLEIAVCDAHLGMYAWAEETNDENYNLNACYEKIVMGITEIVNNCKPAEIHLVFNGDFLHSDNHHGTTDKSGHILDMDSRFQKVICKARDIIVDAVKICTRAAPKVVLHIIGGNHDPHAGPWLSLVPDSYYNQCENVVVDTAKTPHRVVTWGDVLVSWAHGHNVTYNKWQGIISTDYKEQWAATSKRYLHLGHIHHRKKIRPIMGEEQIGLVVEYLPALCPLDSFASEHGFIGSLKGVEGFLYSKQGMKIRYPFEF